MTDSKPSRPWAAQWSKSIIDRYKRALVDPEYAAEMRKHWTQKEECPRCHAKGITVLKQEIIGGPGPDYAYKVRCNHCGHTGSTRGPGDTWL